MPIIVDVIRDAHHPNKIGVSKRSGSENISKSREPHIVQGYTHITSFHCSISVAGEGAWEQQVCVSGGRQSGAEEADSPQHLFPRALTCSTGMWVFSTCSSRKPCGNGAISLSMRMPAKNTEQCVRGGQVIWAASLPHIGEWVFREWEQGAGSPNKTEFVFP